MLPRRPLGSLGMRAHILDERNGSPMVPERFRMQIRIPRGWDISDRHATPEHLVFEAWDTTGRSVRFP